MVWPTTHLVCACLCVCVFLCAGLCVGTKSIAPQGEQNNKK